MAGKDTKGNGSGQKSARPQKVTYVAVDDQPIVIPQMQPKPPKKKINWKKGFQAVGLTVCMLAVTAATAYGGVSYYYSNRFFEGTYIDGIDCSGMTAYEAEEAIADKVEDYSIEIASRNVQNQSISGKDINYTYASHGEVLELLKKQNPLEWVRGLFEQTSYATAMDATYDKKLLEEQVKALECAKEENQVAPENAYVAFQNDKFEIVPETEGSEILLKEAYKALDNAISSDNTRIDLGEVPDVYVEADLTSESPELQEEVEAYNNLANASITYTFGDSAVVLDGSTIQTWLQFDEKGQLVQNDASFQQKVQEYVAQLAAQFDTVGTERPFNTTNGRTVYVYGSAYGWQIDQAAETEELIKDIRSGEQISREPIYSMKANAHGYNDFGDTYIEVDLSDQHMYYYQNGSIVMDSEIVSGQMSDPSRQTPSGVYTLYYKKSPDVLRGPQRPDGGYEWEANVSFWMPFNGGIGFHDATWQPYFGGDRYLYGGSHGCINLPYDAAAYLYNLIDYNVPIICFY